jgi:glycyl-tRNA synthetase beta subunit
MKKLLPLFFLFLSVSLFAQEQPQTIKIKREQNLVKAVFDNTEYRLFAVDRFGNPRENEFVSYTLWIKEKKDTKKFIGYSNTLTPEMLKELKSLKKATKIFFTNIQVNGDDDHIVQLPDVIDTWFPDCTNCLQKK